MLPKAISSYITSTSVINYNTAYRTLLFIRMTQFEQEVGVVNKYLELYRIKCVKYCVFVYVFH